MPMRPNVSPTPAMRHTAAPSTVAAPITIGGKAWPYNSGLAFNSHLASYNSPKVPVETVLYNFHLPYDWGARHFDGGGTFGGAIPRTPESSGMARGATKAASGWTFDDIPGYGYGLADYSGNDHTSAQMGAS